MEAERVAGQEAANALRAALDPRFAADQACLAALDDGASAIVFTGDAGSTKDLTAIYRRRLRHIDRVGLGSIGGEEFLPRLASATGRLTYALVETEARWFAIFLDGPTVAGCLGVARRSDRQSREDPRGSPSIRGFRDDLRC